MEEKNKEDKRIFPVPGFCFTVELHEPSEPPKEKDKDVGYGGGFAEVTGIMTEVTTEELVEGGENRFKHRLPSTISHSPLVLKRGIIHPKSYFAEWVSKSFIDGVPGNIILRDITVNLLNEKQTPMLSWRFVNAYPIKYEISGLKADSNQLAIETIELSYQYME